MCVYTNTDPKICNMYPFYGPGPSVWCQALRGARLSIAAGCGLAPVDLAFAEGGGAEVFEPWRELEPGQGAVREARAGHWRFADGTG